MAFLPLALPPGIFRNGTLAQAFGRWYDSSLVRWSEKTMQAVGGWQAVEVSVGDLKVYDNVYLSLPGAAGNSASVPDEAAFDITGDIEIRAALNLTDWTPGTERRAIVTNINGNTGYGLYIESDGKLSLRWGDNTVVNASLTAAILGATDGTLLLVRASLDVDDGAADAEIKLYSRTSTVGRQHEDLLASSGWTTLDTNAHGAVTSITASTAAMTIGQNGSDAEYIVGGIYGVIVYTGIAGTRVLDVDFSRQNLDANTFVEDSATAATITVNVSGGSEAEIVGGSTSSPVMSMFAWKDNNANSWLAMGTPYKVWAFSQGVLIQITPYGLAHGGPDATTSQVYETGAYGAGVYGEGDSAQSTIVEAQSWQFDNFGQFLTAQAFSDGTLYFWDPTALATDLAVVDASAPVSNTGQVVTAERFLVALGADDDPRVVQWADQESLTTWTATAQNQAGDFPLSTQGGLMVGHRGRGETLLWTTQDIWSMRYIGGTLVYSFDKVGSECGPIGRKTIAIVDGGRAFWMGANSFYMYDGFTQPLPSEVSDYVFSSLNRVQVSKIFAVSQAEHHLIRWYYPSGGSDEIDRYVDLNYTEGTWAIGQLNRTAGIDRGVFAYPMAADRKGVIYDHERGSTYIDIDSATALVPYATSGPIELTPGQKTMAIMQIIPDEATLGDVQAYLITAAYPTATETENGPYTLSEPTSTRVSGRHVRLKVEQVSPGWRVGAMKLDVFPAGER